MSNDIFSRNYSITSSKIVMEKRIVSTRFYALSKCYIFRNNCVPPITYFFDGIIVFLTNKFTFFFTKRFQELTKNINPNPWRQNFERGEIRTLKYRYARQCLFIAAFMIYITFLPLVLLQNNRKTFTKIYIYSPSKIQ